MIEYVYLVFENLVLTIYDSDEVSKFLFKN